MAQQQAKIDKPGKRPEDRKRKDEPATYRFEWDGHVYVLPPPDSAVDKVSGRQLRDAYMDGEEGQMRLGFAMLEHVDCEPGTLDALYDMPAPEFLAHLQAWMELRTEQESATVGESLRLSS